MILPIVQKCFYTLVALSIFWSAFLSAEEIIFTPSQPLPDSEGPTVLLSILARNKEHVLPAYFECLDRLNYPKELITVYINTNNNVDQTETLLFEWILDHKDKYRKIIYDSHESKIELTNDPHDWNEARFKILAKIRNKSLSKTLEHQCDYYFVVDCDNFIASYTLLDLISQDKPIIAPLLRAVPQLGDPYSNYFTAVNAWGYMQISSSYFDILYGRQLGVFEVPVVHCTYLIKAEYIKQLSYIDGSADFEFVIFSRIARKNKIAQFITNLRDYGYLLHFADNLPLQEEADFFIPFWQSTLSGIIP